MAFITKFTSLYFVARIAMEMSVHSQLLFSNKHYRIQFHELEMDIVCKILPLWHIFFAVVIVFSEKQQQKEPQTLCCVVTLLGGHGRKKKERGGGDYKRHDLYLYKILFKNKNEKMS